MNKKLTSLFLSAALMLGCLMGCGGQGDSTPTPAAGGPFTAGTYEGEGQGNNGPVKVSVTFTADAITEVKVTEHGETQGLCEAPIERIPAAVMEGQTLAVDAVSGATNTSRAILEAVAACITAAGADPADFQTPAGNGDAAEVIDVDCNILVVGAGGAGLTAALSAIQNGAEDVIVIEKQAVFGSASAVAGGLAGGCSELQKSFGITEDSPEQIYADIMKGGHINREDLVKLWSENMGSTLDWLIENKVPITQQFSNFPEHTYQRSYHVDGGSGVMLEVLSQDVKDAGGQIHMETKAQSFLTDNGAVTGVVATDAKGNTVNYHANKVILASGGFGANPDMLTDGVSIALFYGAASSTGEGIKMAEDIGAQLSYMDYAKMYPTGIQVEDNYARVATVHTALTTQTTGAILVNKEGQRVLDENLDFVSIKEATKQQTDHIIYLVMDQAAYDVWSKSANDSASPSGRFTYEEQENWFNSDAAYPIFSRDTDLAKAAEGAGIDGEALVQTVKDWNSMVAAGKDTQFGRDELAPLAEGGTYYIIEQKLRFATTLGGVTINTNFEVLDNDNNVIPGLYAAGECVGGAHGDESMPTCMLSWAVTSGKLAGAVVAGK